VNIAAPEVCSLWGRFVGDAMLCITATDTSAAVALNAPFNDHVLHAIAEAWIRPVSDFAKLICQHLGTRSRARSYCLDRTSSRIAVIRFSPYKRPDPLRYRNRAVSFVWDQLSPFAITVHDLRVVTDPLRLSSSVPPSEFIE
jgi:hypothetical protein